MLLAQQMPPEFLPGADGPSLLARPEFETALRTIVAVALGFVIAWMHRVSALRSGRTPGAEGHAFASSLVLLSGLVAATVLVISDSIARAFSLVGALAIVRFRTVVEDTRDTAFLIFAVVAGMAAGTGTWNVVVAALPLLFATAWILARRAPAVAGAPPAPAGGETRIIVRIGLADGILADVRRVAERRVQGLRLVRTASARQGSALEVAFTGVLRDADGAVTLVRELNATEGVQSVEAGEALP